MTDANERDAAFAEFQRYLTKMIRDFDAAGLTGRSKHVPQMTGSTGSGIQTGLGHTSHGNDEQESPGQEELPGRSERGHVRELADLQEELRNEISEASRSVAGFASSEVTASSADAASTQREVDAASAAGNVRPDMTILYDVSADLRAVAREQDAALSELRSDLMRIQIELQAELHRMADDLELKAVAIDDYFQKRGR